MNTIDDILQDLRDGKMIVLVDDESRENEGDLVCAAETITAEKVNFMARLGRGLICLTMTNARADRLALPLMTQDNTSTHGTAFTIKIDANTGRLWTCTPPQKETSASLAPRSR